MRQKAQEREGELAMNNKDKQTKALQKPTSQPTITIGTRKSRCEMHGEAVRDMKKVTGTQSDHAALWIFQQAASALVFPRAQPEDLIIETAAVMAEMAPQNATEAMLSVQMVAVHGAAMMFLRDATLPDQTPVGREANVLRATRLMRVFNEQLEAMRKLQGKGGRQQVTVEHVHVHQGGQAIVGAVSTSKRKGGGDE